MGTFKFRLAVLLKLREAARNEKRAELAAALRAEETLSQRIATLEQELDGLKKRYKIAAGPGALNVDQLVEVQRYEVVVRSDKQTIDSQMQALAAEIARRREALVAADKEVRILEKLRDNQHERFRAEEEQIETKILDEVASLRGEIREACAESRREEVV